METIQIICPNCGHDAGSVLYSPERQRNLPPLAPLPFKPSLDAPDPQLFGFWMRDEGVNYNTAWHRPGDLHTDFVRWWVTEGGARSEAPTQRRMSIALVALGWVWKNTKEGRVYRYGGDGS